MNDACTTPEEQGKPPPTREKTGLKPVHKDGVETMKAEIMLFVRDVEASSRWYQSLLGLKSAHGGREYEMIVDDEKNLVFQLHRAEADEHGDMALAETTPRGAGVLIYVQAPDVRAAYAHAKSIGADVQNEPLFQDKAGHTEFVVRDPDGYSLALYARGKH